MRRALTLGLLLLAAAPAFAQETSVSYTVTFEAPGAIATGDVPLRIRVSGGVRPAEFAAYHLRTTGAWSQGESVKLEPIAEDLFEDTIITEALPNGRYQVEVRVWGDVPPYNPNDPRTYARGMYEFAVENAPETPTQVQALTDASSLRLGWDEVETSDREDFLGYVVFLSKGSPCPSEDAAYRRASLVSEPLYEERGLAAGSYCARVAAVRRTPVRNEVLSPLSPPVKVSVVRSDVAAKVTESGAIVIRRGEGITFEVTEKPKPPPAPELPEGDPVIADGSFAQDLPYGPQTVTQVPGGGWPAMTRSFGREAGVDPKRTATLFAGGLVLATCAALIGRFVTAVPRS